MVCRFSISIEKYENLYKNNIINEYYNDICFSILSTDETNISLNRRKMNF